MVMVRLTFRILLNCANSLSHTCSGVKSDSLAEKCVMPSRLSV